MRRKERSEQISAARMDQIRLAASKVFANRGFMGATTDEIAREADVSPGLLFHYFKSKKGLLVEVVASLAVESLTRSLSESSDEPVDEVLLRFLEGHGEFMLQNLALIKVVFYEAQFHEDVRAEMVNKLLPQGTKILEGYFQRQVAAGVFRDDLDVPVAARAFFGLLVSFLVLREVFQDPVLQQRERMAAYRQMIRLFLAGVRMT